MTAEDRAKAVLDTFYTPRGWRASLSMLDAVTEAIEAHAAAAVAAVAAERERCLDLVDRYAEGKELDGLMDSIRAG